MHVRARVSDVPLLHWCCCWCLICAVAAADLLTETLVGNATPFSTLAPCFLLLKTDAHSLQCATRVPVGTPRAIRGAQSQGGDPLFCWAPPSPRAALQEPALVDHSVADVADVHDLGAILAGLDHGGDGFCAPPHRACPRSSGRSVLPVHAIGIAHRHGALTVADLSGSLVLGHHHLRARKEENHILAVLLHTVGHPACAAASSHIRGQVRDLHVLAAGVRHRCCCAWCSQSGDVVPCGTCGMRPKAP